MKATAVGLLFLFVLSAQAAGPLGSETPVSGFRLPTFTAEGHRSMLLQGTNALVGSKTIEVQDLNLTLFKGDAANTIETVLLSPSAVADLDSETLHGDGPVRVIHDEVEITGHGWAYDHALKKVSITSRVRVVFHATLPDILK